MTAIIPPVTKLSSRIIRILGCNPGRMTLQGTNTYIIGTGKRRILLDAGEHNNLQYITNLSEVLKDERVDLEHIIVTHWHQDHIGGVADVLKIVNKDCSVWKFKRTDLEDAPLPDNIQLNFLKNGEEITTEGATLRILHTPGHTTDHIVVCLKEENAFFSGDCILGEGTAVFEDLHDYMLSLGKILELNPNIIYPGHGPVVEAPIPKIQYYIDHRNKRELQLLDVLTSNADKTFSEMDLVKIMYQDTPESLYAAAAFNMARHLDKLLKEKKVTRQGTLWKYNKKQVSVL